MGVPSSSIPLLYKVYTKIIPSVHKELAYWENRAKEIPNKELQSQALASIESKTFHCEGGAIIGLIAEKKYKPAVQFIVAYQTISDYLDNLCDRSTSLDEQDFSALHEAMEDALTPGAELRDYYRYRDDQEDGKYLEELVRTCQAFLAGLDNYEDIKEELYFFCQYYCELQIYKHITPNERVDKLKWWFSKSESGLESSMTWYEFSACTGSTLGVFNLISYALRDDFEKSQGKKIVAAYFPYIQGLHILLDYFIDQEEDLRGGDLNFCFYYNDQEHLEERLEYFIRKADKYTKDLPHKNFHKLINRGLIGIYLSDNKVGEQSEVKKIARQLVKSSGPTGSFFYLNGRAYRGLQKIFQNFRK